MTFRMKFAKLFNGPSSYPSDVHEGMRDMLRKTVTQGTGRAAALRTASYGKTGTSQNSRDALFIGWSGDLVVGVWVGNDDNSPMRRVTGGMVPAPVWREIMTTAMSKPAKSYYSITSVASDFSFQDLLGKIIGSGEGESNPMDKLVPAPSDKAPIDSESYKMRYND